MVIVNDIVKNVINRVFLTGIAYDKKNKQWRSTKKAIISQ